MLAAHPKRVVLKFGGTSVGSPERIRHVAQIIKHWKEEAKQVVVVVSAMGDATDDLIELALKVSPHSLEASRKREMDMLLSVGERSSMALLSLALHDLNLSALSFTGSQSGIITTPHHGEARITQIKPMRIEENLEQDRVVIVAGFQGVSIEKEITTLGRGGSDTSAVALGISLGASEVVIYTDVEGVFSADPRIVPEAKKIESLGWDTALVASSFGAQVLHSRCVELAWKYGLPLKVCSSFKNPGVEEGSWVKGVDMETLEGPKVLCVTSLENLNFYQKNVNFSVFEECRAVFAKQHTKLYKMEYQNSSLVFVCDSLQDDFVQKHIKPEVASKNVSFISVVGVGLENSDTVKEKFLELLKNCEILSLEFSSQKLSAFFKGSEPVKDLVAKLHSALVEEKLI